MDSEQTSPGPLRHWFSISFCAVSFRDDPNRLVRVFFRSSNMLKTYSTWLVFNVFCYIPILQHSSPEQDHIDSMSRGRLALWKAIGLGVMPVMPVMLG